MASSSKKRTTMAKLAREQAVRERRAEKQLKKEARREASVRGGEPPAAPTGAGS